MNTVQKVMFVITLFIVITMNFILCDLNNFNENENNVISLSTSSALFSAKIYQQLLLTHSTQNILISPVSLQLILGLLQLGSEGLTAEELSKVLVLPLDRINLAQHLYQLQNNLNNRKSSNSNNITNEPNITITNAIYVRPNIRVAQDFYNVAKNYLNADIRSLENKASNEHIVTQINQWISKQTNQQINHILQPEDITIDTKLLLLNTLHFKGKWVDNGFNISETKIEKFHKNENISIPVPMMHTTGYFFIGRYTSLNITYLELPYSGKNIDQDGDYILAIYLPDSIENGLNLIQTNLNRLLLELPEIHEEQVEVRIPRFRINVNIHLKSILENLGVKHAFSNAHLQSLTLEKNSLSVSNVIHNSVLDVNEEGTEASAATIVGLVDRIFSQPIPFVANKPFVFVLKQKPTNIILFIGHYDTPQN